MEHYRITLQWKGLPEDVNNIGTFIVDESELDVLEEHYGKDLSIDVWDVTTIKRKYEFADVLRSIDKSSNKVFGALIYRDLMDQIEKENRKYSLSR